MATTPQKHLEVLERRKDVARRYLRGEPQYEIARAFDVDAGTISRDLMALREQWQAEALTDTAELKAMQLAKIDEVERNAWVAFAKSQEDAETIRTHLKARKGKDKNKGPIVRRFGKDRQASGWRYAPPGHDPGLHREALQDPGHIRSGAEAARG